eukprot:2473701-Prymnesium_polylepis.1
MHRSFRWSRRCRLLTEGDTQDHLDREAGIRRPASRLLEARHAATDGGTVQRRGSETQTDPFERIHSG